MLSIVVFTKEEKHQNTHKQTLPFYYNSIPNFLSIQEHIYFVTLPNLNYIQISNLPNKQFKEGR